MLTRSLQSLSIVALWLICGALVDQAASADAVASAPTKSAYTFLNPTPDDALRAFTPDRPARSSSPITVDAGRFQIESDFLNYTFSNQLGVTTRTYQAGDPVLKLGITEFMDFEVTLGGYINTRTVDNTTGATPSRGQGFGDVTLASKFNLVGNDGGKVAFGIIPYLIVPSGTRNVTAGQVEGGVIAPLALSLPYDFSMTLQTEADALANVNGPGTHINFTNVLNMSHEIPGVKDLTGTAEVYTSVSSEKNSSDTYTFDLALAYLVEPSTQLDVGANIGLNRGTPDLQVYSGIARRF